MRRILLVVVALAVSLWLLPTVAAAQTKISGTAKCKVPAQSTVEVGDRPNHAFTVIQGKCTWVKPWTIEGIQNKKGTFTEIGEISGNSSQGRGYFLDTMANGNKVHYRYENNLTWAGGMPQSGSGNWRIIRGTGKLIGIQGHGTCQGKPGEDGSVLWECEGEYKLPK